MSGVESRGGAPVFFVSVEEPFLPEAEKLVFVADDVG